MTGNLQSEKPLGSFCLHLVFYDNSLMNLLVSRFLAVIAFNTCKYYCFEGLLFDG